MSTPSTETAPEVGSNRPKSMAMVVVLPAPLPPNSPVTVPAAISTLRSSTASTLSNRLVRATVVIAVSGMQILASA